VDTFGTASIPESRIVRAINRVFSFEPAEIIEQLDLRRPIYSQTTNYGHFGKNGKDITWEKTDKAKALRKAAGVRV
jgi:S-adenosylmethionine synthetase